MSKHREEIMQMVEKREINEHLLQYRQAMADMSDDIFDHPEIGFKEFHAQKLLTDALEEYGFNVEKSVGGIETSFRATYANGEGGSRIGLLCEYDALPMGHGCSHHMQGPILVQVARCIKEMVKDTPYTLVVYGTPAEEGLGGKVIMAANGCFKDIDLALMVHGGSATQTDVKSQAMSQYKIFFHGIKAHAMLKPEAGRSALDALLLACNGIEFLREHVRRDVQLIYNINHGGLTDASVPAEADMTIIVQSYSRAVTAEASERVRCIAQGAALMTGTEWEMLPDISYQPKILSRKLNQLLMDNAAELHCQNMLPAREQTGASDFGDVTQIVPGSVIRFPIVGTGVPSHSQAFLDAGKTQASHDAMMMSAQVVADTCLDILYKKGLLQEILDEYAREKEKAQ